MGRGYGDVSGYSGVTQDSNNYVIRLILPRNRILAGTLPSTEAFAYVRHVRACSFTITGLDVYRPVARTGGGTV